MKKKLLLFLFSVATLGLQAQRATDVLDRGLVAVKTSSGVYCSWRVTAEEYYDVKYNIYRDGTKLNAEPLSVSNFTDTGGSISARYTVEPVVRGKAQAQSAAVTPWAKNYKEIKMDHGSLKSNYIPNDACVADVDGDGELEILLKFDNRSDVEQGCLPGGYEGEYAIIEVYKLDGTKLWWIDLGPNMADFQNNENNIIAYDWDGDGRAEAVMRAADGTTIHTSKGETIVIGDKSKNYRSASGYSGQWFVHDGAEFLLYLNGQTGELYQQMEYPLKRLEPGETNLEKAWGDGYGHRSTKHFFGAPYLDGRKPSIFMARGIYTRHKMVAYDVEPSTHKLVERWRWNCNTAGSPWYGQGYHNFGIADVDWDGRDEIVYGSMVIDDNGKGLSTTGLGHGDSQHCSDFDPYTHGQEIFACNEDAPNNNFRDATTSKIYYRTISGSDDGRAIMGNFINDYPGAQGVSAHDGNLISSVTHDAIPGGSKSNIAQNFRIFWDGDLCSESFNYVNGKNTAGAIYKPGRGVIATMEGSMTNNDTKGTPCYQGDILGDWREELIMRTADGNIRIYTTDVETPWRNYTLWHDHQYRQAMVWQMCGYNQTPHVSYFLGELEGITKAPAPLTMTGRTEIRNGATIGTSQDDKHVIMCETGDMTVSVSDGASPYILTVNAPTWVQGHDDNNNITTTVYTHTIKGGAFGGAMRLVKQGDGILNLPAVVQTYSGPTDVWAGTLNFDGTMANSRVWLNRFAELNTSGGNFAKGLEMEYASVLRPGGKDVKGTVTADSLILNYGAIVELDVYSSDRTADLMKVNTLKIGKKDWTNGPAYMTPVFKIVPHLADGEQKLAAGRYLVAEVAKVDGNVADIVVDGLTGSKAQMVLEDGLLYIDVMGMRDASEIVWTGANGSVWDLAETENFKTHGGTAEIFVDGDVVVFDDDAKTGEVTLAEPMTPASVVFSNNTLDYTVSGSEITGKATLVKNGAARTTITNINSFTGGTTINAGTLVVASLANNEGVDMGSLGTVNEAITINNAAVLSVTGSVKTTQTINVGDGGAAFDVPQGATLTLDAPVKSAVKAPIYKRGTGTLRITEGNSFGKTYLEQGTITSLTANNASQKYFPDTLIFNGVNVTLDHDNTTYSMTENIHDYTNFSVPYGKSGNIYLDGRCTYHGSLTGEGTFRIYPRFSRSYLGGDWSKFVGTLQMCNNGSDQYGTFAVTLTNGMKFPAGADVVVDKNAIFNNNGVAVTLKSLSGEGTLQGGGAYTIGSGDADVYFRGSITSPVNKIGAGTWRVGSAAPQGGIGTVNINGGTLHLDTYYSGTTVIGGTVNVNDGAALVGIGAVKTLVLNSGSTVTPGLPSINNFTGFIKAANTFNAKAGSVINLCIYNNGGTNYSRSYVSTDKFMFMNSTVNLTLDAGYTPAVGDEISLWSAPSAGNYSGNPVVNLPELPEGLAWDITELNTYKGLLKVVTAPSAISSLNVSAAVRCRIFTAGGLMVAEFDSSMAEVASKMRSLGLAQGAYILKVYSGNEVKTSKVVVR